MKMKNYIDKLNEEARQKEEHEKKKKKDLFERNRTFALFNLGKDKEVKGHSR